MAGDFSFDLFLYYSAFDRTTVRALAEQLRHDKCYCFRLKIPLKDYPFFCDK